MIDKIIEVYEQEDGKLKLDRPAFDILIDENGRVSNGQAHSSKWQELCVRSQMNLGDKIQPRGKLDKRSAEEMEKFKSLSVNLKLPGPLKTWFNDVPEPRPAPMTFDEGLQWLERELARYQLGLRVTTPGGS